MKLGLPRAILLCIVFVLCNAAHAQALPPAWVLGPFHRPVTAPVVSPDPHATFHDPVSGKTVHWEYAHTFNPAAAVRKDKVVLLYRAEDNTGKNAISQHTSRLGLAQSGDGIHFNAQSEPTFYPAKDEQERREFPGGTEDPRLVQTQDGTYVLTYTQWNRKQYTVGIATSKDLVHWKKYGPAFQDAAKGKYRNFSYKSAGILTRLDHGRLIAARLHGKYWMYWGEVKIGLATSTDLIHWTPVEDAQGKLLVVLASRPGLFDSAFPEIGPPPVLTSHGIVVLYNGKNALKNGAPGIGPGAYSAGQALFSAEHPSHLLARLDHPYLEPKLPFEKTGQYVQGTVFTEGLVYFKHNWFLYYGAADTDVGVAEWEPLRLLQKHSP